VFLFRLIAAQPVLEQEDAVVDQQLFKDRHLGKEAAHLILVGIAHDALDPGAVVPAAVEQDDFARTRQVGDIALETTGRFPVRWAWPRRRCGPAAD
jgi:hypothetical protein